MNKPQILSLSMFLGLFLFLYFGCDTKSKEHIAQEKSRAENFELLNVENLIRETTPTISTIAQEKVHQLNDALKADTTAGVRIDIFKAMASLWYQEGHPLISGYYAEKIAKLRGDDESWGITGTTFALATKSLKEGVEKDFALEKSRKALQKAIDLNPDNPDNHINMALSYVDNMDMNQPMKGILMLREVSEKFPEYPAAFYQLGRLALGTNQLDKAVERLEKAIELDPNFKSAYCLLAETFNKKGDIKSAQKAQTKCELN